MNYALSEQPVVLKEQQDGLPGFEHRAGLWVTIAEVARMYGVTQQSVRDWISDRIITKPINGQINLTNAIKDIYTHQRKIIEGKSGSSHGRYNVLRADRMELELEEKRGSLIAMKEVQKIFYSAFRQTRDAMQNIPPRVSAIFAAETEEFAIKKQLTNEIDTVLTHLSKTLAEPTEKEQTP